MHILLTGASGSVGSHVLTYLLSQGHSVLATDAKPLPSHLAPLVSPSAFILMDLTIYGPLEDLLKSSSPPCDAIIHLAAVPAPTIMDHRDTHNVNVTSTYNVLKTAADLGITKIAQASSVNAPGLGFTLPEHQKFDAVPMDEETPMRAEDAYGLSKQIVEVQASAMCRLKPEFRVASLRFHMVKSSYQRAWPHAIPQDLWGWVSFLSSAEACLLALTSEGWYGHEVFNIVAPNICWEGGLKEKKASMLEEEIAPSPMIDPMSGKECMDGGAKATSMQLLAAFAPETVVKDGWWGEGNERRGFWDTRKAERMLGWVHKG